MARDRGSPPPHYRWLSMGLKDQLLGANSQIDHNHNWESLGESFLLCLFMCTSSKLGMRARSSQLV